MSLVVFCDFGGSSREVVTSKTSGARHSVIETSFNNHQNWIFLVINLYIYCAVDFFGFQITFSDAGVFFYVFDV